MGDNLKWGEPFFFVVNDCEANGSLYRFNVDGHGGAFLTESEAIDEARGDVEGYGFSTVVYRCVPVARVEPVARSVVTKLPLEPATPHASGLQAPGEN